MPSFLEKKKNLIILLALIFIQMVLISVQAPLGEKDSFLKKTLYSIFVPVQEGVAYLLQGTSKFWGNYFFLHEVKVQNNSLKEKVFILQQENDFFRRIVKELKGEKEVQEIFKQVYDKIIVARIIGIDAGNVYKSLNINKGSIDGVRKDMVVLDNMSNLVGRIIVVTLNNARIQLVTDHDSGVSVTSEKNKSIGVLSGWENGLCQLNYILTTNEDLGIGNIIITTGYDGIYLPGIKVGEIISMEDTPSLFKKIVVKPYYNLNNSNLLAVINISNKEFN